MYVGEEGYYSGTNQYLSCYGTPGTKGFGGDGNVTARAGPGGGGGGYFGGGGSADVGSGGGGSGYISENYFSNGKLISGNVEFPSPSGSHETGHTGNGFARIAVFIYPSCLSMNYFRTSSVLMLTVIVHCSS